MWNFMGEKIDPSKLITKQSLLDYLNENGANNRGLSYISDRYENEIGFDPVLKYPLTDGFHEGSFIVPVCEGFLLIPYDEMDIGLGEILILENAVMIDANVCEVLEMCMRSYADSLCAALRDMKCVLSDTDDA